MILLREISHHYFGMKPIARQVKASQTQREEVP